MQTSVPSTTDPAQRVELPLRVTLRSRSIALLRGLIPVLEAGLLFVAAVTLEGTASDRLGALLSLWPLGLVLAAAGVLLARPAFVRRPRLVVEEGGIRIEHSGVLRTPFAIARADIRLVAVTDEPGNDRRLARRKIERFELEGESGSMPRWIYGRGQSSPYPLLGHSAEAPNVALVFNRPIALSTARRTLRLFASLGPTHIVRPRQPIRGLLLRVQDPHAARTVFAERNLIGGLSADTLGLVAPDVAQHNRALTGRARANLLLALVLAVNLGAPILVSGPGPA